MATARFREIVSSLKAAYRLPKALPLRGPFERVLFECAAYLVDDERKTETLRRLKAAVGADPAAILAAPKDVIANAIAGGGMMPARRVEKVREAARLAMDEFEGDVGAVVARPFRDARRALARFPGIGEPGAEKILLLEKAHKVLALESNGLRALVRLGLGEEKKGYAATYRSAQEAAGDVSRDDFDFLIAAHRLLRFHGQATCKASRPLCDACPLAKRCPFPGAGQPPPSANRR